ncbi:MAG: hypothetical protein M1492_08960 [Gammaproteobacteria bacterium]|jgi:hypothetical protein|uniref:hypothetical protein n=1 Tax=Acidithiobacillus ferrooxidans TaxID=920 RepID=UPI001C06C1BC|nr:hypothetical protein [Acidithiobacillus ferrooxidans]MCL4526582.1 hypothetical protein [Gammaproteobacteria bacterium]MDA8377371.1 hypothetical protein [Planctomycetia bacterium]MBU2774248.1 hypothetical protein [Acidithiobacillus ferrooxidans]MCR1345195.1 hypothetical protein [Acidithiobacillus ferrooxidans]MCR1355593.1 hypothetical protein [Acidithiobacillus ferrooxidans]
MQNRKTIYAIKAAFWFSVVCGATGWFMFTVFRSPEKAVWVALAVPFAVLAVQAVLLVWRLLAKNAVIWWECVAFAEAMIGALFLVGAWDLLPGEARFLNLLAVGIWVIPVVFLFGAGHEDFEAVKRMGMGLDPYQDGAPLSQEEIKQREEENEDVMAWMFPHSVWGRNTIYEHMDD